MSDLNRPDLITMTVGITANYVSNNRVSPDELPALIASIHSALTRTSEPTPVAEPVEVQRPTMAQIKRSITDLGIVSFLDGKTYQSLKRHLTKRGMTPSQYREQFGLPNSYPLVAPAYSQRRSEFAKSIGLGQKIEGAKGRKSGRKPKSVTAD